MPDSKITALTSISTSTDPANDPLVIVDLSDTSMAATGTTKKVTLNQLLGASGTATLASATITGDLTVDTNVLKVDTTLNRVGILTASPTQALHVRGNILTGSAAGTDSFLNVTTDGVQNSLFGFNNSGSTNSSGASNNNTYIGNGNNYPVQIVSNGALVATFSSTTVRIANNNIVMATSGTGIDFSATSEGSGTMTSELLNDYEEGTWTPTAAASSGTPTTVTIGTCKYTKIGRQVIVTFDFTVVDKGTASGSFIFSLPFISDNFVNCGSFRENGLTGYMGQVFRNSTGDVAAFLYNNTTVWVDGYKVLGTYSYCI